MEEMKATARARHEKMEASHEKIKVIAEHYKWAPCVKEVHLLTALQGWASDVLYVDPKERHTRRLLGQLRTTLGASTWLWCMSINLKHGLKTVVSPCRSLPLPLNS